LVSSFRVGGTPLERYYHHVFPHEHHVRALIEDLGLTARLGWYRSSMGVFADGRLWPFTSPLDLLRFGPLPLWDRLRTGLGALRLARVSNWEDLDAVPARHWLARYTGERAARVVWEPLLRAKFGPAAPDVPAAWMWGRFQQRAGARGKGGERLGYLRGGFEAVFDALHIELERLGAKVRTSTSVRSIKLDDGRVEGVADDHGLVEADGVVFTGPLPAIVPLLPPAAVDDNWRRPGLGVMCLVLELTRPVSSTYWTNVCDDRLPFGGIIEHTNMVPPTDYGGRHVVYLSRYFTGDEAIASSDLTDEAARWVAALDRHHPGFSTADVIASHPFRTSYAAPLVSVGYRERIPVARTEVGGLYLATTAQIYPQDRGMSEGIRCAGEIVDAILADRPEPLGVAG
jgi:protoporphyrinogen oxidase